MPNVLNNASLKEILLVGHSALECKHVNEMRRVVLSLLERVLNVDKSNFFLIRDEDKLNLNSIISRGIEEKFLNQYRRYYSMLDPWLGLPFNGKLFPPEKKSVTLDQILRIKNLIRTEYYNDFYRPQAIHHQMNIYLYSAREPIGMIALFRPKNEPCFTSEDRDKATMMAPYISGALAKTIASDKNSAIEVILNNFAEDLPIRGMIVLDEPLEIIYCNENAENIIATLSQGKDFSSKSVISIPKEILQCCQELKESAKNEDRFTQLSLVVPGIGQTITVSVRLINYSGDITLFVVFLDPEQQVLCLSRRIKELGLTDRELELTYLVSQGLKNIEISDKLCISIYTVETHLRNIYQKIGVRNRTELLHTLLQMLTTKDWFAKLSQSAN